jgi:hypothetical protein
VKTVKLGQRSASIQGAVLKTVKLGQRSASIQGSVVVNTGVYFQTPIKGWSCLAS